MSLLTGPVVQEPTRPKLGVPMKRAPQKDGPKGHEMLLRMMITGRATTHIVLMSGDQVSGIIYESDKYTVSIKTTEKVDGETFENPHPVIIFKHAIERMWFHLPGRDGSAS